MVYIPSILLQILSEITKELEITHRSYSEGWIQSLEKNGNHAYILGLHFPLNTEVSTSLAKDKVATYSLLTNQNIPAVPHILVTFAHRYIGHTYEHVLDSVEKTYGYPIVVKPNTGSEGKEVYLVHTRKELLAHVAHFHEHEIIVALSPFMASEIEYRVVVLYGKALLVLGKKRQGVEWRHNIGHGAIPVLEIGTDMQERLKEIACNAAQTLDLAVASVDIFCDTEGNLHVLEINAAVSLLGFAHYSNTHYELAKGVYRELVRASLHL